MRELLAGPAVGDAHDPPAGGDRGLIAEAVGPEVGPVRMALVAVELELRPVRLDLVALETG